MGFLWGREKLFYKVTIIFNQYNNHNIIHKQYNNWNTVCGTIQDLHWRNILLDDNPVEVWMNICPCWLDVMFQQRSSMCVTRISLGLMINAGMLFDLNCRMLIFGWPVTALGLTGKSLSAVKWELMKPTRRPSVSLVTDTGLFLWMSSPLISGGPLFSLWSSERVRMVYLCGSRLARLICCRIILKASSPARLLICRSLDNRLLGLPPLPTGRERSGVSW